MGTRLHPVSLGRAAFDRALSLTPLRRAAPRQLPYVIPGAPTLVDRADRLRARRAGTHRVDELAALLPPGELEHHLACRLCGSDRVRLRYRPSGESTSAGDAWAYTVGQCVNCGLFSRVPAIKVERVPDLYSGGDYSTFLDGGYARGRRRRYRTTLDAFRPLFDQGRGRTLLDYGCGTGLFLNIAKKRGFDVYGVDLAPDAVARARQTHGADRVFCGTLADVQARTLPAFDVITMWSVLAHLADPIDHLSDLRGALEPGGRLLILTVNASSLQRKALGNRWNGFTRNHLMFWDATTLARLAREAGFSDVDFRPFYGEAIELGTSDLSPAQGRRFTRAVDRFDGGNMLRAVLTK